MKSVRSAFIAIRRFHGTLSLQRITRKALDVQIARLIHNRVSLLLRFHSGDLMMKIIFSAPARDLSLRDTLYIVVNMQNSHSSSHSRLFNLSQILLLWDTNMTWALRKMIEIFFRTGSATLIKISWNTAIDVRRSGLTLVSAGRLPCLRPSGQE